MLKLIFTLAIAVFAAGCATKYGDMNFTGGVEAQQVTNDTSRIIARGNGYTDRARIQDYTLLKAAETTKKAGATHFVVVGAENASTAQTHVTGSRYIVTASTTVKPGADTYIKVMTLPSGAVPPQGAIQADEIIAIVGSRVERDNPQPKKL